MNAKMQADMEPVARSSMRERRLVQKFPYSLAKAINNKFAYLQTELKLDEARIAATISSLRVASKVRE